MNTQAREISPDRGIFHEASIAGRPPHAMYLSSPRSLPGSERTAAPCRPGPGLAWPSAVGGDAAGAAPWPRRSRLALITDRRQAKYPPNWRRSRSVGAVCFGTQMWVIWVYSARPRGGRLLCCLAGQERCRRARLLAARRLVLVQDVLPGAGQPSAGSSVCGPGSSQLGNRMLGCRRVRAGCEVFRDQPGSLLGVD